MTTRSSEVKEGSRTVREGDVAAEAEGDKEVAGFGSDRELRAREPGGIWRLRKAQTSSRSLRRSCADALILAQGDWFPVSPLLNCKRTHLFCKRPSLCSFVTSAMGTDTLAFTT